MGKVTAIVSMINKRPYGPDITRLFVNHTVNPLYIFISLVWKESKRKKGVIRVLVDYIMWGFTT